MEAAAETALWLYDKYPTIKAYLDGPKSLEELQSDLGKRKGYDVHHIVEKTPARDDKEIPDALIDGPDNLVRIPRLKHWESPVDLCRRMTLLVVFRRANICVEKIGMKDDGSVSVRSSGSECSSRETIEARKDVGR